MCIFFMIGCQLTIANGVAHSEMAASNFMLITYTCNTGYRFNGVITQPGGSVVYACFNNTMTLTPPPCERKLYDSTLNMQTTLHTSVMSL